MRIQHNIAAMNSYRNYTNNTSAVAKNLEKLSSGYKINRAGDDAAGLAISEKMRAQITGLQTAQKNAKDGISLVKTAEGALTEVHDMLNRMYELAEQSSNGVYDNEVDRANLQKEVASLSKEIDRIADSVNFNGINLLDGSLDGGSSAGGLTGSQIASFKGAETNALSGTDASTATVVAAKAEYTIDFTGKTKLGSGETLVFENVATADVTITEGTTANVANADTLQQQLAGIATALNGAGGAKYDVTVDGNKLVFKAKNTGTVTNDVAIKAASTGASMKGATVVEDVAGATAAGIDFSKTDTVNVDGVDVKVDWSTLTDDEKAVLQKNFSGTTNNTTADDVKKAAALIQDTINKAIDKTNAAKGTSVQHIKVAGTDGGAANVADTFKLTSGQKDGASSIKFTGGANTVMGQVMGTAAVTSNAPATSLNFSPADISNGKFTMSIGNETVEVALGALAANATSGNVVDALNSAINTALTNYDTAHGLSGADAMSGKVTAKLNDQGRLEFANLTGKSISFEDKDDGEIAKTLGIVSGCGTTSVGGLTLQIGDTADSFNQITVSIKDMHAAAMGIGGIDISQQGNASTAMAKIKDAINYVSDVRGDLGATQNRLEHTINNLSVMTENIQDAESSIRDVDVAEEMMAYTKNNILVQSAQAMLAQANQLPQGVLQLLQ